MNIYFLALSFVFQGAIFGYVIFAYGGDLQCDYFNYNYYNDSHVARAISDYWDNCKGDIITIVKEPLYREEFREKYGDIEAVWSQEGDYWVLYKMKGMFTSG